MAAWLSCYSKSMSTPVGRPAVLISMLRAMPLTALRDSQGAAEPSDGSFLHTQIATLIRSSTAGWAAAAWLQQWWEGLPIRVLWGSSRESELASL